MMKVITKNEQNTYFYFKKNFNKNNFNMAFLLLLIPITLLLFSSQLA